MTRATSEVTSRTGSTIYKILIGLAAREVALVLTLAATIVARVKLRPRKDLWLGGTALTVTLVLESYLGGLIRDDGNDALTAVHVPLGMLAMGLVAALAVRADIHRRKPAVIPRQARPPGRHGLSQHPEAGLPAQHATNPLVGDRRVGQHRPT